MAEQKLISVTHINVRQSISFLIIKLIIIEVFFSLLIVFLSLPFFKTLTVRAFEGVPVTLFITVFLLCVLIKCYFSFFVIFYWLNEYYEISASKIIHRSGFIFRHEDHYTLSHISSIGLQQNLFGRILNYGTIELYDRFDERRKYLYLIHNPARYFHVIESLLPRLDETQQKIRDKLVEANDEETL